MSVETLTLIVIVVTFAIYIYIGWWAKVRDTKSFYVAGNEIPAVANGAAIAADWMSGASFISMAGLISFLGYDGTIYLREVGVVSVHGYKLYDLRDRLKNILSQRYSTINPSDGEPTTHYDLSLKKLKLINISVNGEVVVPGNYSVSSHSSALDVLKLAKGITAKGTMREIYILRKGSIHSKIDFYDYLLSGNTLINELKLTKYPVAVRLIAPNEEVPKNVIKPLDLFGSEIAAYLSYTWCSTT